MSTVPGNGNSCGTSSVGCRMSYSVDEAQTLAHAALWLEQVNQSPLTSAHEKVLSLLASPWHQAFFTLSQNVCK